MGLERMADDQADIVESMSDVTVSELVQQYGREATKRGLQYIISLSEAEQEFKQSANPKALDEGWREGFDIEDDIDTDASDIWAEKMEERGLGLDE